MSEPTTDTKFCHRCGQEKPVSSFHLARTKPGGLQAQCKPCQNDARADWKRRQDASPALREIRLAADREVHRRRKVEAGDLRDIKETKCAACEHVKPTSEFHLAAKSPDGYRYECRSCVKEYRKLRARSSLNSYLYSHYRLTVEQFDEVRRRQGYRCGICDIHEDDLPRRLGVDHCHRTLGIRGLLCTDCNQALGKLGDSAAGLRRALDYLLRFEGKDEPTDG